MTWISTSLNGLLLVTHPQGSPILETNIGFRSQSRSSADSPQVTKAWRLVAITFLQALDYLPSYQASPPVGQYQIILLGDRGTCVNNLPRVALGSAAAWI